MKVIIGNGSSRCIACHNDWGREYYRQSAHRRERMRRTYVLRKYGMSLEDLQELLRRQNGRCAICRKPWQQCVSAKRAKYDANFMQYLCVDHHHQSGKVRGLLCNGCNAAIGMFEEDRERFRAAAEYLDRHSEH